MNLRTKLFLRMTPFLARRIEPLRAIDRTKYLYLRRLLEKYRIDVVLDVGANVGQFARSLRRIGYRGRILSFEPQADAYRALTALSRFDNRWQVYNCALGAASGWRDINIMASHSMSSFHLPDEGNTAAYVGLNKIVGSQRVEIKRLDEAAADLDLGELGRCLLKSDTQGFDLEVLRGAGTLLGKIRLLMLEMSAIGLYQGAPSMSGMLTFLDGEGFAPGSFFPASVLGDDCVPEFDYVGINRRLATN